MTERSYQDAVQVLKDRMGGRWEGVEAEGRDEMVSILKEQLGYDSRAANDAIDAMIESGTLRYHRTADPGVVDRGDVDRGDVDPVDEVVPPVVPAVVGTAGAASGATGGTPAGGLGAVPLATGAISGGYWQIGSTVTEVTGVVGRAGQVEPH
jgi:hypothetical protein